MKVKTIRKHMNAHAPVPVKNPGRIYEVSERDGRNLIASGLVEEIAPEETPAPEETLAPETGSDEA